jgi:hypothetical protein
VCRPSRCGLSPTASSTGNSARRSRRSRLLRHEFVAEYSRLASARRVASNRLVHQAPDRLASALTRDDWPDFVCAFHDSDEIGPRMPARSAECTGLTPGVGRLRSALELPEGSEPFGQTPQMNSSRSADTGPGAFLFDLALRLPLVFRVREVYFASIGFGGPSGVRSPVDRQLGE